MSPADVSCHLKFKLTVATLHAKTKYRLDKLLNENRDIFSKHSTHISKTNFIQMTHIPKDNIKPLDQTPYMLASNTMLVLEEKLQT